MDYGVYGYFYARLCFGQILARGDSVKPMAPG